MQLLLTSQLVLRGRLELPAALELLPEFSDSRSTSAKRSGTSSLTGPILTE